MQPVIGLFDSGIGGYTVLRELARMYPNADFLYFGDSLYAPYGPRPKDFIIERAQKITDFLLQKGAKIIVVACNTATASAIASLRNHYSLPFIGMEPAIKPAALNTKSGAIGVLATKGTFHGEHFHRTKEIHAKNVAVYTQVGYQLVERIEEERDFSSIIPLLEEYLTPMLSNNCDQIVLGCTHYPLLIDEIKQIVGSKAKIVNPAHAVARQTVRQLNKIYKATETNLSTQTRIEIFSSKLTPVYKRLGAKLFGGKVTYCEVNLT